MRGRDDRAAANQRAINALYQARLRAVTDCRGRVVPEPAGQDRPLPDRWQLTEAASWDCLNVEYLKAEWPPSMLC